MQRLQMNLSNEEWLFLGGAAAIVVFAVMYFKGHKKSKSCKQKFSGFSYNPNVTILGTQSPESAQASPVGMEYMTTPPLLISGANIPYQRSMIRNHPVLLSRQELEDMVATDSLGMGPGMVEGYRFRGNLNL